MVIYELASRWELSGHLRDIVMGFRLKSVMLRKEAAAVETRARVERACTCNLRKLSQLSIPLSDRRARTIEFIFLEFFQEFLISHFLGDTHTAYYTYSTIPVRISLARKCCERGHLIL